MTTPTPADAALNILDVKTSLDSVTVSADKVSTTLTNAFSKAVTSGKSFDQTLQSILTSLSKIALNAGMQPLQQGISALVSSGMSGLSGASITPFADGGVVSQPTFFGSGGSVGLMGERGAEAIVPLSRGPDGRLGLAAAGQGGAPVHLTVNIATPDAEGFRKSLVQVTGALARAVARGQRGV